MKPLPNQYRDKGHPVNQAFACTARWGTNGAFIIPHYRISGYEFCIIVTDGLGWEHVSVTIRKAGCNANRCPTWEEMCEIKNMFWYDDQVVVQYHPAKGDYVNCHPYCLHLWRPVSMVLPTPNPLLVGIPNKNDSAI